MRKHVLLFFLLQLCLFINAQDVDVFLIGGQSNATGQGQVRNIPAGFHINPSVSIFYSQYTNRGENSMKWIPLCPAAESTDRFGVEVSLGTSLKKLYPNQRIAIIKHGLSGSNLYAQWNPGNLPGETQGPEYKKFIATVQAGLAALKAEGLNPVIRAMFWQQGEADARELAGEKNNQAYGENLKNFIQQVRQDVSCPDMPFIYGTVLPLSAERFPGRNLVKEAQHKVAEAGHSDLSVTNAILVEADDLQMLHTDYQSPNPKDDVHLGTFGLLTLGERFAKAYNKSQETH